MEAIVGKRDFVYASILLCKYIDPDTAFSYLTRLINQFDLLQPYTSYGVGRPLLMMHLSSIFDQPFKNHYTSIKLIKNVNISKKIKMLTKEWLVYWTKLDKTSIYLFYPYSYIPFIITSYYQLWSPLMISKLIKRQIKISESELNNDLNFDTWSWQYEHQLTTTMKHITGMISFIMEIMTPIISNCYEFNLILQVLMWAIFNKHVYIIPQIYKLSDSNIQKIGEYLIKATQIKVSNIESLYGDYVHNYGIHGEEYSYDTYS